MKFCINCGKQLNDEAMFCSGCGAKQDAAPQPQQQPVNNYNTPPVPPVQPTGDADVQQNRGIAWLAYVGLLLLVPLFARKRSPYCQFHVKQGATLLAVEIAYQIVQAIFMGIIGAATAQRYFGYVIGYSPVYYVFQWLFIGGNIFLVVLSIIGIVKAATGKTEKLPLVGKIPFVEMLMDKIYAALNK